MNTKPERYRQYAENARKRAQAASQGAAAITDNIPMGQPILIGHHSEGKHRRDLSRVDRLTRTSIEERERAEYWDGRAARVERRENVISEILANPTPEGVQVGDTVIATFTNSGYIRRFKGVIVRRNKNDWLVRALESPYEGEEPGRVFHIAAAGSRKFSANNRVYAEGEA